MNRYDIGPVRLVAIVQNQGSAYYLDDGSLIQVPIYSNGEVRLTDLQTKRDLEHGPVDWQQGFAEEEECRPVKAVERLLLAAEGAVPSPESAEELMKHCLNAIAAGVPREEEWRSAADFMEHAARMLDIFGIARPQYYED